LALVGTETTYRFSLGYALKIMNDESFVAGSYYQNDYSKEQNQQFAVQFDAITLEMASYLEQGLGYDSTEMQQAVQKHYDFCLQFWTPNRETYKSLAMSYVLPTGFNETYEGYRKGLGKYMYDAVSHFADTTLS
jgi:hypothetical protein